jgi:DNA invertase Pin-like site-specific DNA recombinase
MNKYGYVRVSTQEQNEARQSEGIAAAKRRGVRFGRPLKQAPADFGEIVKKWRRKEISIHETLKRCKLGKTAFYQRLREYGLL